MSIVELVGTSYRGEIMATAVKVKRELIKTESCETMDGLDSGEIPEKCQVQRSTESSRCSRATSKSTKDSSSLLRYCRLCALPKNNMVDIFSLSETEGINIPEEIEYCLRILVKKTDTLPTQACWSCLEELELCYQFNKITEEAQAKLLCLDRQISGKVTASERNCESSSEYEKESKRASSDDTYKNAEWSMDDLTYESGLPCMTHCRSQIEGMTISNVQWEEGFKELEIPAVPEEADSKETLSKCLVPIDNLSQQLERERKRASSDDKYENAEWSVDDLTHESGLPCMTHRRSQIEGITISNLQWEEGFKELEIPTFPEEADSKDTLSKCLVPIDNSSQQETSAVSEGTHIGGTHSSVTMITNEDEENHRYQGPEQSYNCSTCKKTFDAFKKLKLHKRVHLGNGIHRCSICDGLFKNKTSFRRHMRVHDTPKTALPWQCEYCKKCLSSKSNLNQHSKYACKNRPDSEKRLQLCFFCGKPFKSEKGIREHIQLHTGEGLHICEYCGKKFPSEVRRGGHYRSFHAIEQPFQCSVCKKTFSLSSKMKQHALLHR